MCERSIDVPSPHLDLDGALGFLDHALEHADTVLSEIAVDVIRTTSLARESLDSIHRLRVVGDPRKHRQMNELDPDPLRRRDLVGDQLRLEGHDRGVQQ